MSMFQISRRADYAVRIMVELGVRNSEGFIPSRAIAATTGVSKPFLHKICASLAQAGLLQTVPGAGGGVALAQLPDQISLLDILTAIEGPVCVNVCLIRPHECPRDVFCPAHGAFAELQQAIVAYLERQSLAALIAEARRLKQQLRQRPLLQVAGP